MSSDRIIHLEPVDPDEPLALTDVVIALYLEDLPIHGEDLHEDDEDGHEGHDHEGHRHNGHGQAHAHEHHDDEDDGEDEEEPLFELGPLSEAVVGAFALGSAMGLEYPERISTLLEQTHPGQVGGIVEECRGALTELVQGTVTSGEALEAEDFVEELLESLAEDEHAEAEDAQNALSMAFEYGLILAHVHRNAAISVRNAFNREQAAATEAYEAEEAGAEAPGGPDPFLSLQELAREVMVAYETDIGFGPR
ncbi:MAG: hypothetical protein VW450_02025 [Chloroflexota bacterium]